MVFRKLIEHLIQSEIPKLRKKHKNNTWLRHSLMHLELEVEHIPTAGRAKHPVAK